VSYYVGVPLVILLALSEATVLPMFRVVGLQPNLVLVVLVAWLMIRGSTEAFILIPLAGVFLGLADGAPLGTSLIALAPIAFLQEIRGTRLTESGLVLTIAFTVLMTLVYNGVYFLIYAAAGDAGSLVSSLIDVIVPTTFLNVVVLLPVYFLISLLSLGGRRSAYA
jgi:rod shape-determining protein MreD